MSGTPKQLAVSAMAYLIPVAVLQAGCTLAEPPKRSIGSLEERFTGPPLLDRAIRDGRITESSGLARSTYQQDVLFTDNDRGDTARIFAVLDDGRTAAVLTIEGARHRDWEDIAAGPAADQRPGLRRDQENFGCGYLPCSEAFESRFGQPVGS